MYEEDDDMVAKDMHQQTNLQSDQQRQQNVQQNRKSHKTNSIMVKGRYNSIIINYNHKIRLLIIN